MSRPRICPHCEQIIPAASGFHFDANLNMIHDACGKVVVPVTIEAENEATKTKYPYQYRQPAQQQSNSQPPYSVYGSATVQKPYTSGWEE